MLGAGESLSMEIPNLKISEGNLIEFQEIMLKEHELEESIHFGYGLVTDFVILAERGLISRPAVFAVGYSIIRGMVSMLV